MANQQIIMITGAVAVIGGLFWWMNRDDDNEEPVDRVLDLTQDKAALESFKRFNGSLYPAYGASDLMKPDARKTIVGSEACAQACLDDEDCIAFTHWEERYSIQHPKGADEPHPDVDLCYYWSGPQGEDVGITPDDAVGPSSEGKTDAPAKASLAKTYILRGKEDYIPSRPSAAETGTPYPHPSANPTGSSFVIVDSSTKV